MSAAGIFLAIKGQPVDLDELAWYERPPCGCTACGVHSAYSDYGNGPALVIATPEQATEHFWPEVKVREKYERLGFTVFADLRSKCRDLLMLECPHEPRFGVPPRPEMDGYTWAVVHHAFSHAKLMHLVPDLAIEDAKEKRYGSDNGRPLCGGKKEFHWSTEWYAMDGTVECTRCIKKAAS